MNRKSRSMRFCEFTLAPLKQAPSLSPACLSLQLQLGFTAWLMIFFKSLSLFLPLFILLFSYCTC